jgi:peptidoglycan L-alanyl-D-glutamate endopeptidase CwlK
MTWGKESKKQYDTIDPRLQRVLDRVCSEVCDIRILVGNRNKEDQDLAYATGRSKVRWPNSKHNALPSLAVDITPTPVNFKSQSLREELSYIAGALTAIARQEGITVRWGGDWDQDGDLEDNSFDDLFHFEIKE